VPSPSKEQPLPQKKKLCHQAISKMAGGGASKGRVEWVSVKDYPKKERGGGLKDSPEMKFRTKKNGFNSTKKGKPETRSPHDKGG